ncbi:MAG: MXAN_6521/LA_1396 family lipoprotein [Deltaproteobacteria bacterium]|nr:MXAN_6521/LA_1396 family lipoprotein [Deltaproteobacteria bacterium]
MKLADRIAAAWADFIVARPWQVVLGLLALTVASAYAATLLRINTNQLDLISQDLQAVKDVKRVVDMVGGAGHLILALRGKDEKVLKQVADDLHATWKPDKTQFRNIAYKVDISFVRDKAPLFVETKDLEEIRRQVMLKVRDTIRRASPFFIEIKETKPYELTLDPIIEKYKRVGKKSIADDYYISDDKQMVLMVIKPMWDGNELDKTGKLTQRMRADMAAYAANNAHGYGLFEDYSKAPDANPKVVEFGFTGSYQTNYDDSYEMQKSLVPVGGLAALGVLLVMLAFLGRYILAVTVTMSGLAIGVVLSFGFDKLAVGELNMITSILSGILMGQGIDFGIHFIYRMRIELGLGRTLEQAIRNTCINSGVAAFISAAATGTAFFALLFSEFRGFSQFGLLAGVGVFITGLVLFSWSPAVLVLLARKWPNAPVKILGTLQPEGEVAGVERRIPWPRVALAVAGAVSIAVSFFAKDVVFDYNTRALMVEHQPSVMLQDELNDRYQISADPVGVYTKTTAEAKALFDELTPLDKTRYGSIDQVVSMWSFVPPRAQQEANVKVLQAWKADLAEIEVDAIPEEHQENYKKLLALLDAKPYDLAEVPTQIARQFTHLPTTKPENHGYLTFLYPKVDLWDGKQMLQFNDEVEEIKTKAGATYRSAGSPILFAKLARIVLWDGKFTVALTAVLLLLILVADFRSVRNALVALVPLLVGMAVMLGGMALAGWRLNFMNIVVFPIVLGYGVSHGVYFMHRFLEGTSPYVALRSVGAAVAASTLTTLAGWSALLSAGHKGLKSMGILACVGMVATLWVSFTIMPAILQLLHDRRVKKAGANAAKATGAAALALFAVAALPACGGTVQQVWTPENYAASPLAQTKRLAVAVELTHDGAALPADATEAVAQLWANIARRYANQHRDFIVRATVLRGGDEAVPAACALGAADKPIAGALLLRGHQMLDGDGARVGVHGELLRCSDKQPIWRARGLDRFASADPTVAELTAFYTRELGPAVAPYVAPVFHLLRAVLATLPTPVLSDDETMEKIELGE